MFNKNSDNIINSTVTQNNMLNSNDSVIENIKALCQNEDFDTAASLWLDKGISEFLSPEDLAYLGSLFNKVRNYSVALDLFNEALKKSPTDVQILVNILYTLIYLRREPEAIAIGNEFEHFKQGLKTKIFILLWEN
jgi:tetratricopeptide (TPR) repeat protein